MPINRTSLFNRAALLAACTVTAFCFGGYAQQESTLIFLSSRESKVGTGLGALKKFIQQENALGRQVELLFPDGHETRNSVAAHVADAKLGAKGKLDLGGELARRYGVTRTPSFIRIGSNGAAIGTPQPVSGASKSTVELHLGQSLPSLSEVNYFDHVQPIIKSSCVGCHSPGQIAPFELNSFAQTKKWSKMIAAATGDERMPPWRAIRGYRSLLPDHGLTAIQQETLRRWDAAGAPQGSPNGTSISPPPSLGWPDGTPDAVLSFREPYKVEANSKEVYRMVPIKTNFNETKYIRKVALKPGDRRVVHHIIVYVDRYSSTVELDGQDGMVGYSASSSLGFLPDSCYGGWAPGAEAMVAPPDSGFELPPGATLVLQMHYSPIGVDTEDSTQLGLYFLDEKPKLRAGCGIAQDFSIQIEPGEAHHVQQAEFPLQEGIKIYAMMPHMHLLGKTMRIELLEPKSPPQTLIKLSGWDFDWQLMYAFEKPVLTKKDSALRVRAVFDNSPANPNNPNKKPRRVRYGLRSIDEMMFVGYLFTMPFVEDQPK